jgi:trehalose/maltose hydrolase-like predicted phosphorylase
MSTWILAYDSFEPDEEGLREALSTTGNGYFCTRGAAEWADADDVHYPGTYMHGGFDRATTMVAGRPTVNEDLVNLPNWLALKLRIEGGESFSLGSVDVLSYRHEIDIRSCSVNRTLRFRDSAGRESVLASRRFVSMAQMHLAGIEWTLTPQNWSGSVEVTSGLDGRVTNWGVARYRELEGRHLTPVSTAAIGDDGISLLVRTHQSQIHVAQAARTLVFRGREAVAVRRQLHEEPGYAHQTLTFDVAEGVSTRVEKRVAFFSSRDKAISEPLVNAETAIGRSESFADLFEAHATAWEALWKDCDIRLPQSDRAQLVLRLHASHVLQTCSPNTVDLDAGVPARGLSGEAYRGHIFWDELYIYPFFNFRLPEITRSLLMYRYRRLDEARASAKEHGYRGAMYPWQSGSDGSEETQVVHLNPKSGSWDPDSSHNQRHVNAAIFYNVWHYVDISGDMDFLERYGAEMLLEIARFWASIAHFDTERGRYEVHGVMGPDEYHEGHFGAEEHGLRNNAYTNVMVAWMSGVACSTLDRLPPAKRDVLRARIGLADAEIETWKDMSATMYVPFHGDGVVSQFEGFEALEEFDWEGYREKYGNIQRLDRILKAEGESPDRFQLAKQADTLMLWYLFADDEVRSLFERLGYPVGPETARTNIDYYYPRTSHGSTLSLIVHAKIEASRDPEGSWDMFLAALESDVNDIQGGTTKEGIHMGVMAGTLDLVQRGYLGTEVRDGVLHFRPRLTDKLDGLSFRMRFRGTGMDVGLEGGVLTLTVDPGASGALKVAVGDRVHELEAGESRAFSV